MDSKTEGNGLNNPEVQKLTLPTIKASVMEEIDRAIRRCENYIIESAVRNKNGQLGWAETADDGNVIDPWCCADAILALLMVGYPVDSEYIAESENSPAYFIADQLTNGVKIYVPQETDEASIPGTSWCLIAISEVLKRNPSIDRQSFFKKKIRETSEWLKEQKQDEEGWSFSTSGKDSNGEDSNIYATAIAMRGLLTSMDFLDDDAKGDVKKILNDSIKWLIDARNDNKLWGRTAKSKNTSLPHSAHVLIALLDADDSQIISPNYVEDNCVEEILRSVDSFLHQVNEEKDDIRGSLIASEFTKVGMRVYHYDLPWVITATSKLLAWKNKGSKASPAMYLVELINRLLNQQKGNAFIPIGHPSIPIWATHDGIFALDTFRRNFTTSDLLDLFKRKNNLKNWIWFWAIVSSLNIGILLTLFLISLPDLDGWVKDSSIAYFAFIVLMYIYAFVRVRKLETRDPRDIIKNIFQRLLRDLEEKVLGRED